MIRSLFAAILLATTIATQAHATGLQIKTVPVTSAGNAPDPATGYGAVAHDFRISKSEITVRQYVAFLNAVAQVPPNPTIELMWVPEMASGSEDTGPLVLRTGSGTQAAPYHYAVAPSVKWASRAGDRPMPWVTWWDAARFANWMHNGGTPGATTETGAYTLVAYQTTGKVARNPGARWWIPSEDEWYKAAYFDPAKAGGPGYWAYATRSSMPPRDALVPDAHAQPAVMPQAPAANFNEVYKPFRRDKGGVLVPVCAYASADPRFDSRGPWGSCDQAGSLWEWTEAVYLDSENHIVRGGSWGPGLTAPARSKRRDYGPMGSAGPYRDDDTGFRLATQP